MVEHDLEMVLSFVHAFVDGFDERQLRMVPDQGELLSTQDTANARALTNRFG